MEPVSVFVIDDEVEFVHELVEFLRNEGAVASGSSAASFCLSNIEELKAYEVFIVDYAMPDIDGASFIATVRSLGDDWGRKRFILCSGCTDQSLYVDGWKAGVFEVIEKPVFHSDVISVIFGTEVVTPDIRASGSKLMNQHLKQLMIEEPRVNQLFSGYKFARWAADIKLDARLDALKECGCEYNIAVEEVQFEAEREHFLFVQRIFDLFERYAVLCKNECRVSMHAGRLPDDWIAEFALVFSNESLGTIYHQEMYDLLSSSFDLQYFDETDCKLFLQMSDYDLRVRFAVQLVSRARAVSVVCLIPPYAL